MPNIVHYNQYVSLTLTFISKHGYYTSEILPVYVSNGSSEVFIIKYKTEKTYINYSLLQKLIGIH